MAEEVTQPDADKKPSEVVEAVQIIRKTGGEPPVIKKYTVTVETGIFKNGRLYAKGEQIDMPEETGNGFVALSEVEEVK